jgi:hypothetical protein
MTAHDCDDIRGAYKMSSDSLDRFREIVAEVTGHGDRNPGDDILLADLREIHGKTGPEPTRWRDFITGAKATVDQINAGRISRDVARGES